MVEPANEPSPDPPPNNALLTKLFAAVDLNVDLLHYAQPSPCYSVETSAIAEIQHYARAARLLELQHRWHPRGPRAYQGARGNFFREAKALLDRRNLEMWQPLTSWLEVYATRLCITPLKGLRKMAVFTLQRELTDKLADIARVQMDAARNLVMLCGQIGLVECKDQLERQLRQVYLDVLRIVWCVECSRREKLNWHEN
jgi:hypothetical protein